MSADAAPPPRSATLGLVVSLVVPGAGFVAAGRPVTGACLAAAVLGTFFVLHLRTVAVLLHLYQAFAARNLIRDRAAARGRLAGPLPAPPEPGDEA